MKKLPLFCALGLSILPTIASADAALVRGDAALASFEHVSADGCVHTVGELVLVEGSEGAPLANGVYVTGSREDVCAQTGMGFATFVEGELQMLGLFYAHYEGSFVAESYSGGEPVEFDVDLTWIGKGRVSHDRNVFEDENGTSFTFSARRNASLRGSLLADGVPMSIVSATLLHETNGTLTH